MHTNTHTHIYIYVCVCVCVLLQKLINTSTHDFNFKIQVKMCTLPCSVSAHCAPSSWEDVPVFGFPWGMGLLDYQKKGATCVHNCKYNLYSKLTQTLKITNFQWKLIFQPLSGRVYVILPEGISIYIYKYRVHGRMIFALSVTRISYCT